MSLMKSVEHTQENTPHNCGEKVREGMASCMINTFSMKGYRIIYFEHRNDVTNILKLCPESTSRRRISEVSCTETVISISFCGYLNL